MFNIFKSYIDLNCYELICDFINWKKKYFVLIAKIITNIEWIYLQSVFQVLRGSSYDIFYLLKLLLDGFVK